MNKDDVEIKLLPCPFCEKREALFKNSSGVCCDNPVCPIYGKFMSAQLWNTRAVTDSNLSVLRSRENENVNDQPVEIQSVLGLSISEIARLKIWFETKSTKNVIDFWESINGADSWDANPWVWAINFTVYKQNVGVFMP